jgi:chorismate dehydratase
MQSARVACVRYLNTAPLVEGLDRVEGLTLLPAVPARIVDMLVSGEADVGLASVVDAVRAPEPLAILPAGMIGCDGPTLTVRVFSRVPLDKVATLHADADSHTSVVLATLLLRKRHGVRPRVVTFDARERVPLEGEARSLDDAWPQTVLLIGDKVVTDPPSADRYPYRMDLGEAWHAWTGLPFVYAAWQCRAADQERLRAVAWLLDRQRRHNMTRLGWIVAQRAPAARWPLAVAQDYLGNLLRYDLDARAREGLARFLDEAAGEGLLPARAPALAAV